MMSASRRFLYSLSILKMFKLLIKLFIKRDKDIHDPAAFNNLSDAGSSVISFAGFYLAGKKPDRQHPFGHGRLEYVTGLIISALILVLGIELVISSVKKIINPEPVKPGLISAVILAVSVLVKLYMYLYNRSAARKIESSALFAAASLVPEYSINVHIDRMIYDNINSET